MIKDYFKTAMKNLLKKKTRSWLTLIGIFIGIATVVSIISLGQGLENAVAQQFQVLGVDRISVSAVGTIGGPPGTSVIKPITRSDLTTIQRTRGVEIASGLLIEQTITSFDDEIRTSFITTIPRDTRERNFAMEINNYEINEGRMLKQDERTKIVMGARYAESPIYGRTLRLGDELKIKDEYFEIVGFLKRTGSFQVDGVIIMAEETARTLFNNENEYAVILSKPSNVEDIDIVAENIRNNLRKSKNERIGRESFEVATSQDTLDSLNEILSVVTYFLIGLATISIFVGGIGVMNTMFTSILERTKEIGIMKSIGARNSDILSIFLIESGLLGLVGGIIGLLLGIGFGLLVQTIGRIALGTNLIQASFTLELILGSLIFSFIIGIIAGLLPALRASKLNPVDSLRD